MAGDTRAQLVSAAAKLLDRGGPATVTLREVGKLAGVSHNTPYKHFASKEELLAAIATRELTRHAQAMGELARKRPIELLKEIIRGYVRWALARPERFKLTFGRWDSHFAELASAAGTANARLFALVEGAQKSRDLPKGDPERLAALLLSTAHGAADRALSGHLSRTGKGHADAESLVDDLFEILAKSARGKRA
jgi:AcrR family transcriptional regulator